MVDYQDEHNSLCDSWISSQVPHGCWPTRVSASVYSCHRQHVCELSSGTQTQPSAVLYFSIYNYINLQVTTNLSHHAAIRPHGNLRLLISLNAWAPLTTEILNSLIVGKFPRPSLSVFTRAAVRVRVQGSFEWMMFHGLATKFCFKWVYHKPEAVTLQNATTLDAICMTTYWVVVHFKTAIR